MTAVAEDTGKVDRLRDLELAAQGARLYRADDVARAISAAWLEAGGRIAGHAAVALALEQDLHPDDVEKAIGTARVLTASVLEGALLSEVRIADESAREVLRAGLPTPSGRRESYSVMEASTGDEADLDMPGSPAFEHRSRIVADATVKLGQPVLGDSDARRLAFAEFRGERWSDRLMFQSRDLKKTVLRLVGQAKLHEWPTYELARRVRMATGTTEQHALLIARTELQRVAHEAARRVWAEFGDLISGYELLAAWENTCLECGMLDGRVYRGDEARPVLPIHPRCACTYAPVTRTWRELGIRMKEIEPPGRVLSGYRYVRGRGTWRDWFKLQDAATQRGVLGPRRYKAWARQGKKVSALGAPGAGRRRPRRKKPGKPGKPPK